MKQRARELTRELARDWQTLLEAREGRDSNNVIHICAQVGDGGLRGSRRQRKFLRFVYKNSESQREEIRKLLHDFIRTSVDVNTRLGNRTCSSLAARLKHSAAFKSFQVVKSLKYLLIHLFKQIFWL